MALTLRFAPTHTIYGSNLIPWLEEATDSKYGSNLIPWLEEATDGKSEYIFVKGVTCIAIDTMGLLHPVSFHDLERKAITCRASILGCGYTRNVM